MLKWIAAVALPLTLVYLCTGHPLLQTASVWGWGSAEILALQAAVFLGVVLLGTLFTRSRPALITALTVLYSVALATSAQEPETLALSYLAAGLFLLAGPEKRLLRPSTAIWVGLAALAGLGTATVLTANPQGWTVTVVLCSLLLWGCATLGLRVRYEAGRFSTDPLLLATLAGGTFLGWTVGSDPNAFGAGGIHGMSLLLALPCLGSLVAHSFRLAYIDELTEIPGRRALVEALDDPGSSFTLAMLDVDHFKKFNDTHGHEVGDQVLRMVAARIATVGMGGAAYRYGGEEFTLIFPGKSVEQVQPELERIRQLVEASPLYLRSENRPKEKPKKVAAKAKSARTAKGKKTSPSVGVTVSIGVATRQASEPWERVMKRADQALYKAKEAGRNQVSLAS